ncbi:MAG: lysine--tRNA ligase [Bacteroidota bacterium]
MSEQETLRKQKKEALEALGINPYPAASFITNTTAQVILDNYPKHPQDFEQVSLAGRIMSRRIMGSASFAELKDASGKIQLYIQRDSICPGENKTLYNTIFKKLLDIGDIVGVQGFVFTTKTGATSVHVAQLTLLSKALKPLPIVKEVVEDGVKKTYDAFTDPEQRYRQRYVDLIVNPNVRDIFQKRTQMIRSMRQCLDAQGYLEVETPILQPIHGGATAKPFITHHNALGIPLYLRIANELYLKRLIVGGYNGVYEFAKDFRNEGMSRFHNPEFTLMEVYVAYKDYYWMMDFVEEMLEKIALDMYDTTTVTVGEHTLNFQRPWKRMTMFDAIKHFTGIDIGSMDEPTLRATAQQLGTRLAPTIGKGKIIDELFGSQCEPHLIQPTFITDYPVEMSPLAKRHRDNPALVERFEVICNGKEICNAFSELNDPIDQRRRFEEQLTLAQHGDEEAMVLDEDFLSALSYGMPPTVGLGIGIDRLAMIMANASSIQEVIFFPQMRPTASSVGAK